MGVQRTVRHDPSIPVSWPAVRDRLAAAGESPVLRMIDGLPAFPDETPADDWRELRVGLSGGMVTLRRQPGELTCITWGTDDPALERSRDALIHALADSTGGTTDRPA